MTSARARRRNVLGAFKVPERGRVGRRSNILLVDDKYVTTERYSGLSRCPGA